MNRDPKKQRKPYAVTDFCFFVDHDENKPEAKAAAAYMRLVKDGLLPPWAVFCFSDFKDAAASPAALSEVVMQGESFLLLAPEEIHNGYQGLLVAEHVVSGQVIDVTYQKMEFKVRSPTSTVMCSPKPGSRLTCPQPSVHQSD